MNGARNGRVNWALVIAIAGLALNLLGLAYGYGQLTASLQSQGERIVRIEARLDSILDRILSGAPRDEAESVGGR